MTEIATTRGDEWRAIADQATAAVIASIEPDPTDRVVDQASSTQALEQHFAQRYAQEIAPARTRAWNGSRDLLVQHGEPLRYSVGGDMNRYPVSTGLLGLEEPQFVGSLAVVKALRISILRSTIGRAEGDGARLDPVARSQAKRARRHPDRPDLAEQARNGLRLNGVARLSGVQFETFVVSTVLPEERDQARFREVRYPQTHRERQHDFDKDAKSIELASKRLKGRPDVVGKAVGFAAFGGNSNEFFMLAPATPAMPTLFWPDQSYEERQAAVDEALAKLHRADAPVRLIDDMLTAVTRPLRDMPAFQTPGLR